MNTEINPLVTITWSNFARKVGAAPAGERSSSMPLDHAALVVADQLATFTYPTAITELALSEARAERTKRADERAKTIGPTPTHSIGRRRN